MADRLGFLRDGLAELRAKGLLLHPRTLEGPTGARARFDGRDVIYPLAVRCAGSRTPTSVTSGGRPSWSSGRSPRK